MGSKLPRLSQAEFESQLVGEVSDLSLSSGQLEALYRHFQELVRWNPRLSLVGPGTAPQLVQRHWAESLAALALLRSQHLPEGALAVDLGSGGGFPAVPLAIAAAPLEMHLVEPRSKKCAFLESVVRKARASLPSLSCHIHGARVDPPFQTALEPLGLPRIDLVTSRALTIEPELLEALVDLYPAVRIWLWIGRSGSVLPSAVRVRASCNLPGSDHRQIVELVSSRS